MRTLGRLRRVFEIVGGLMVDVAGWSYFLAALLICVEIIGRSYLHFNVPAVTEITSYILALGISWGLAGALTEKAHIRIEAVVEMLPRRPRAYLHAFALGMLAFIAVFFTWASWQVIEESLLFNGRDTSALSISLLIPQIPWSVGIALFAGLATTMFLETGVLIVQGRHSDVNERLAPRSIEELTEEVIEAL